MKRAEKGRLPNGPLKTNEGQANKMNNCLPKTKKENENRKIPQGKPNEDVNPMQNPMAKALVTPAK